MENKRTTEQNRADELLRMALEDHILQAEPELKKKDELQKDGDLHKFSPEFEERFENMLRESQNKKKGIYTNFLLILKIDLRACFGNQKTRRGDNAARAFSYV